MSVYLCLIFVVLEFKLKIRLKHSVQICHVVLLVCRGGGDTVGSDTGANKMLVT